VVGSGSHVPDRSQDPQKADVTTGVKLLKVSSFQGCPYREGWKGEVTTVDIAQSWGPHSVCVGRAWA
jgi:hypothetical protein